MKITFAAILIAVNWATAQDNDPHLAAFKKLNVGAITSYNSFAPPPVLIGDVTYGISKRVSLGIVGGTQGSLALVGPKVNVLVAQPSNNFRVLFRFLSIYYPERNGKFLFDRNNKHVLPWMLSMAFFDAEWKTQRGIRWSLGMGGFETHCVDGMIALLSGEKDHDNEKDMPMELFNTVQASMSVPVSKRLIFRIETILVLKGYQLIPFDVYKVASPVNPFINFIYKF